jgi:hypothetical protein
VSKEDFGDNFNTNGGGVYAMQWTDTFIKTWFFPRNSIPASIACGSPDIADFGPPDSWFNGCDIARNFKEHRIVFTTTFCGSWAGADGVYSQTCPLALGSSEPEFKSCRQQVAQHPLTFTDA